MPHPLTDPLLKLQRADENIDALDREISAWRSQEPDPIRITFESHTEEAGNVYRFHLSPPVHAGLVFADAITNIRSALDYVTWQLAKRRCGPDRTPSQRTAFPIQMDPERYPAVARDALKHVPFETWDLIEALQPYNGWDWPELGWFRVINELANSSKHRIVPLIAAQVSVSDPQSGETVRLRQALKDGDVFHLKLAPVDHQRELHITAHIGVEWGGTEMVGVEGLRQLNDFVREDVIPLFAGFFEDGLPSQPPPATAPKAKRRTRSQRSTKRR